MTDSKKSYLIAIDVGGTNTDAALIEYPSKKIINAVKTSTTSDFVTGILKSCVKVIKTQQEITEHHLCAFMLGTTIFLNAVLENSPQLSPVEVIRLCGPLTRDYPPFGEYPKQLVEVIGTEETHFLDGGYEFNNSLVTPLNEEEVKAVAQKLIKKYEKKSISVAIIGVHSPLFSDQEERASFLFEEEFKKSGTEYYISRSFQIGQCGFKERENATILNACLMPMASKTIKELRESLKKLNLRNIKNHVFLTQNDGTLISSEDALNFPIFTFNSGPINSLRGAYQLTGIKDAFVCDIGGTSSDMAILQQGFPRASSTFVNVGGIRTNFRMADTVSIALGGGSVVKFNAESSKCTIGPVSVGYKLMSEAQCFGGKVLTTTDIVCVKGTDFGETEKKPDPSLVQVTPEQVKLASSEIIRMIEVLIEKVKITDQDLPLILVGGGSVLIPENVNIKGISKLVKPKNYAVANAVGAGIAQISATIEELHPLLSINREEVLKKAKLRATDAVVLKGAIRETVEVFVDEVHLAYTRESQLRFICKAIGYLDLSKFAENLSHQDLDAPSKIGEINLGETEVSPFIEDTQKNKEIEEEFLFETPKIVWNETHFEWHLSKFDIACCCLGASFLGAGGGGSSNVGQIPIRNVLKKGKKIRLISLHSLTDKDLAIWVAYYGAPAMMTERLGSPNKLLKSVTMIKKLMETPERKVSVLSPAEIGGMNSMAPLWIGAELDLPILDGDYMGRAFPELQMITPFFNGEIPTPLVMTDDKGIQFILSEIQNNDPKKAELWLRSNIEKEGCDGGISGPPLDKEQVFKYLIRFSFSHTWRLGRNILEARHKKIDPLKVIEQEENGKHVFTGKLIEVQRLSQDGYNTGKVVISGFEGEFLNKTMVVEFKNENLIALLYDDEKPEVKKLVAVVPDLIIMVDYETYQPFLCEELRYGLRASVLILPASPLLRTETALKLIGPKAFGYDCDYVPVADYIEPKSVIDEFCKKQ